MPPPILSDPLSTTFCHSLSIICKFKSFRGITYNLFLGLTCKYPILPKSVNSLNLIQMLRHSPHNLKPHIRPCLEKKV